MLRAIRRSLPESSARRLLRQIRPHIDRILAVPPGNLLLNRYDPLFRAASARCAAMYRNPAETSVGRVAAVAGVLYQIRCNLIHGSKDPDEPRDRMLVQETASVLRLLVPMLEQAMTDRSVRAAG